MAFEIASASAQVSVVGCRADGQMGPTDPPKHIEGVPPVPPSAASELAFYASAQLGVLAPRGWHCFGLYGSSGVQIIVTPEPHNADDLLSSSSGLTGPAVQLSYIYGGTSGRYAVAKIAARLFPAAAAYVEQVIDEGILSKEEFPSGVYPGDILVRRNDTEVEYQTPANNDGIGTHSRLVKNAMSIDGVALLFPKRDIDLVKIDIRVPPHMRHLVPIVVTAVERRKGEAP